jgi:lipopolysaccharide/colanic/teichoic acid biosynthesis glycosyltransferase
LRLTNFFNTTKSIQLFNPVISGWTQISGRNTISWQKNFEYDVWYVQNQSFLLDLKIIFMTIFKVFKAEGISGEGVATMEKFKGN